MLIDIFKSVWEKLFHEVKVLFEVESEETSVTRHEKNDFFVTGKSMRHLF